MHLEKLSFMFIFVESQRWRYLVEMLLMLLFILVFKLSIL